MDWYVLGSCVADGIAMTSVSSAVLTVVKYEHGECTTSFMVGRVNVIGFFERLVTLAVAGVLLFSGHWIMALPCVLLSVPFIALLFARRPVFDPDTQLHKKGLRRLRKCLLGLGSFHATHFLILLWVLLIDSLNEKKSG